jgi:hypothetical protein
MILELARDRSPQWPLLGEQRRTFARNEVFSVCLERLLVGPNSVAQRDVPYGECHPPLRGEPAKLLLMMRFSRDFLDVHARYEVLVAAKGGGL